MNKQECIKRIKSKELKKDKIPEGFLNDEPDIELYWVTLNKKQEIV